MTRGRSFLVLHAVCFAACTSHSPSELVGAQSLRIERGEVDHSHPAVFRILSRKDGLNALCTGVLVSQNVVVTAGHCVAETPGEWVACGEHRFGRVLEAHELLLSNDVSPSLGSDWHAVSGVFLVEPDADLCGRDLAVVVLEEPVSPEVAIPLVPELESPVQSGTEYVAVGYGAHEGSEGVQYGERRSLDSLLVQCGSGECVSDFVDDTEFIGESGICSGDSGGPAIAFGDRVLGVASRGSGECSSPVYSALVPWADWLKDRALTAAERGEIEPPHWASAAVPPAPPSSVEATEEKDETTTTPQLGHEGCSFSRTSRHSGQLVTAIVVGLLACLRRRGRN